jgi:hypothetical protein
VLDSSAFEHALNEGRELGQPVGGSLAELPMLVDQISAGTIALTAVRKPLADVESIWATTDLPGQRTVLVP